MKVFSKFSTENTKAAANVITNTSTTTLLKNTVFIHLILTVSAISRGPRGGAPHPQMSAACVFTGELDPAIPALGDLHLSMHAIPMCQLEYVCPYMDGIAACLSNMRGRPIPLDFGNSGLIPPWTNSMPFMLHRCRGRHQRLLI